MILDQLMAYIQLYVDGRITYTEFHTVMFLLRDVVEEADAVLDGTCAGLVNEEQIRQWIGEAVQAYKNVATPA